MKFANWESYAVPGHSPLRVVFSYTGATCSQKAVNGLNRCSTVPGMGRERA